MDLKDIIDIRNWKSYSFRISKNSRLQGSRAIDLDRAMEDMSVSKSKYFQLVVHAASMCTSTSSLLPALLCSQIQPSNLFLNDVSVGKGKEKQILEFALVANFPLLHRNDRFQFQTLGSKLVISGGITSCIGHSGTHQQSFFGHLLTKHSNKSFFLS